MSTPGAIPDSFHTVVVGAGPAGVMAALRAASAGPVLLVEQSRVPRDKSCGGMLNAYSQQFLAEFGPIPASIELKPRWVHFRYHDLDRSVRKPTSLKFLNVDRRAFDEWLLSLLPDSVTVLPATRLTDLSQDRDGVLAHLVTDGVERQVTCAILIGADGARSSVRRILGGASVSTYVTLQDFCRVDGDLEPFFDCIYVRDIGDCFAYGYVVPKGDEAIVGSVFYPKTKHPHVKHDLFLEMMRESLPLGPSSRREAATALSVRTPSDVLGGRGRVLLAGEAGGWMSPTSGEGISYALNTGDLAGRAVALAAENPAEALPLFTQSARGVERNVHRKLKWLPLMESRTGKYFAGFVPAPIVSRITEGL